MGRCRPNTTKSHSTLGAARGTEEAAHPVDVRHKQLQATRELLRQRHGSCSCLITSLPLSCDSRSARAPQPPRKAQSRQLGRRCTCSCNLHVWCESTVSQTAGAVPAESVAHSPLPIMPRTWFQLPNAYVYWPATADGAAYRTGQPHRKRPPPRPPPTDGSVSPAHRP